MSPLLKRVLIGAIGWGGGMFLFVLWSTNAASRIVPIPVLLLLFVGGGVLFGVAMHYFTRFSMPILARYAGISESTTLNSGKQRPSSMQRIAPSLLSCAPVVLVVFWRPDLLWPALLALAGPALMMLPLASRPWAVRHFLLRTFGGFLSGTAIALVVEIMISDWEDGIVISDAWVCAAIAALWTLAQGYSVWQFRKFQSQSAQPT